MNAARDEFSAWAEQYDEALGRGLVLSGENKLYFARGRVAWLKRSLPPEHCRPSRVLDFGCGIGTSTPLLQEAFPAEEVLGVDISDRSLELARRLCSQPGIRFHNLLDMAPEPRFQLAFCNGVFHHILPEKRPEALAYIRNSLTPGGYFALWENNPWNPGARMVMKRIPFDRDAIMVCPWQAKRQLREAGFEVVSLSFQFIFPALLRPLRFLEPLLARYPFGAQYQLLCRRPQAGKA